MLNPPPGTTVVRVQDFSRQGPRQLHEASLRPSGMPFALRLVLDRDRLGVYFVANPRGGLRQVLAPWQLEEDVTVTVRAVTNHSVRTRFARNIQLAAAAAPRRVANQKKMHPDVWLPRR